MNPKIIEEITKRQLTPVELFVILGSVDTSQAKMAKYLGVSRQRVHQIVDEAAKKLELQGVVVWEKAGTPAVAMDKEESW